MIAVSTYYNPLKGALRKRNLETFLRYLNVPLILVEWSQTGDFELDKSYAHEYLRISGGGLLWQKERLINIALKVANEKFADRDIAILDSDIVFRHDEWTDKVAASLREYDIVQCWADVCNPDRMASSIFSRATCRFVKDRESFLKAYSRDGKFFRDGDQGAHERWLPGFSPNVGNPGLAIALSHRVSKSFYFYEHNIVGGGDLLNLLTSMGRLEQYLSNRKLTPAHRDHVENWRLVTCSKPFRANYVDNDVFHLWHGDKVNRGYGWRNQILLDHDFNPRTDIDYSSLALDYSGTNWGLRNAVEQYLKDRKDS